MKIQKNELYVYTGEGDGKGEIHMLIETNTERCVTWGRNRMSWKGTPEEFKDNFQPLEKEAV